MLRHVCSCCQWGLDQMSKGLYQLILAATELENREALKCFLNRIRDIET